MIRRMLNTVSDFLLTLTAILFAPFFGLDLQLEDTPTQWP